jgi:hypothetical protein
MPTVTMQVRSDDPVPVAIPGVVVSYYTFPGEVFVTSGTTDVNGDVSVALTAGTYDVTFFKVGVSILPRQPQQVVIATANTVRKVIGHIRTMPESPNPDLCRVSGFIVDSHGRRAAKAKITIGPQKELIVISGDLLDPSSHLEVMSDSDGYVEFDLLRGVEYEVFYLFKDAWFGMPPGRICIKAPNQPAVRLVDLLFPLPAHVEFSATTLAMNVGTTDSGVLLTVTYTDGNVRTGPLEWGTYQLTRSPDTVLEAGHTSDHLVLTALTTGICVVSAVRQIKGDTQWVPEPPFLADSLTVTVT